MAVASQIEKETLCQVNSTTAAGPLDILIFKESFGVAWRAARCAVTYSLYYGKAASIP